MKRHSRFRTARNWLLFWCLFIGLGAVAGAVGMLSAPDGSALGMGAMLPFFQVLPFADRLFQDFTFSGWALLIVNGLTNLTAASLLLARKKSGVTLGGLFGVTLMLWICIQFVIFPLNFMSTLYFVFGLAQACTGYAAWCFFEQEAFAARLAGETFPHAGTDPRTLVVYFSRMGYVKKRACEAAEKSGAQLYEIRAKERTDGTAGFWWCGRFGMHRWDMPIEPVELDLSAYERVTLCTPVWVFALSAPMRAFCRQARGKIRAVDYLLVHFQKCPYASVAAEMDRLLDRKHEASVSLCVRQGRVVKTYRV